MIIGPFPCASAEGWRITIKDGANVVATCSWTDHGHRLEIDNIYVCEERPALLAQMFQTFTKRHAGRFVTFTARNDNEQMARFAKLVGAEEVAKVFTVELEGNRHG
ncbi:hypothetical protein [Sphingomonas crocodyli]|uniref:N-acetyltransferase n=1 Tax=Sphingomonas crocodyli TaxID=1979270 RepID=A0A437M7K5_9SPHN|nr:hypothetical protein [Sphingomonas crocodyli]RVT93700.1 hypothetical protein EOD43_07485 [Sphingomonas crocodyli]